MKETVNPPATRRANGPLLILLVLLTLSASSAIPPGLLEPIKLEPVSQRKPGGRVVFEDPTLKIFSEDSIVEDSGFFTLHHHSLMIEVKPRSRFYSVLDKEEQRAFLPEASYTVEKISADFYLLYWQTYPDVNRGPTAPSYYQYFLEIQPETVILYRMPVPVETPASGSLPPRVYLQPRGDSNGAELIVFNQALTSIAESVSTALIPNQSACGLYHRQKGAVNYLPLTAAACTVDRLRAGPGLDQEIRGHLMEDDLVLLIEKSPEPMTIDNMQAFWFAVYCPEKNLYGWAYGYFLKQIEPKYP